MVQTGNCHLPDGLYADHTAVPWDDDLPEQYASGSRHHAGCGRGAPDRPAVRLGFQCAGQYEQRDLLHKLGAESDPESHESKAGVREAMK